MKALFNFLLLSTFFLTTINAQNGGYALSFDGTDDYVSFTSGSDQTITNLTIEAWINPASASTRQIFSWVKKTATVNVLEFRLTATNQLEFGINNGTWGSLNTSTTIETGKWTHVAVTKSGSSILLFINGKQEASGTINKNPVVNEFEIGYYQDDALTILRPFYGSLDEIRVWSSVRTEAEIKANMYKELAGNESGLVAYYKMSDGSGTTLTDNKTGGTNNGTLTNSPSWKASGTFTGPRNALDFDGTDDYVNLPAGFSSAFNGLQHFSFCGWVYPTLLDNALWGTFFTRYSTSPAARVTFHQLPTGYGGNSDDIFISISNGDYGEAYTASNVLELNKWAHLAVVFDGTKGTNSEKIKIFVDGIEQTLTFPYGTNFPSSISSSNEFAYLGRYANPDYFKGGKFDEFSFWNLSLTESQIHEIMFRNLSGNESGLFAYYRFDQSDGTTLYDMTANGYNGTLTNMDAATDWVSSSAFNTWIGSESSTWSTAGNWSRGSAPGGTDNVGLYNWNLGSEADISGTPNVNNLLFSSTASPTLGSNFTVNGNLLLNNNLDLNGRTITLGIDGYLAEGNSRLLGSSGIIRIEKSWGTLSDVNAGGLGLVITSTDDLGWRTIIRGHAEQNGNSNESILRYYKIIEEAKAKDNPSLINETQGGSEFTIKFNYSESELNGLNENNLALFQSTDDGISWSLEGGILNTTDNTVTLSGITNLTGTIWTLGSTTAPLPVELTSFYAEFRTQSATADISVELKWTTATEVNNYGFEVERKSFDAEASSLGHYKWETIGFIEGSGNSNSPRNYSFTDDLSALRNLDPAAAGKLNLVYRLKQIDTDGTFEYSEIVTVELTETLPTEFVLEQNYPNPFNPSTTIKFSIPSEVSPLWGGARGGLNVTLKVYDILGNEVSTLLNEQKPAGNYEVEFNAASLTSGVYFYQLQAGSFVQTKKLILMK